MHYTMLTEDMSCLLHQNSDHPATVNDLLPRDVYSRTRKCTMLIQSIPSWCKYSSLLWNTCNKLVYHYEKGISSFWHEVNKIDKYTHQKKYHRCTQLRRFCFPSNFCYASKFLSSLFHFSAWRSNCFNANFEGDWVMQRLEEVPLIQIDNKVK